MRPADLILSALLRISDRADSFLISQGSASRATKRIIVVTLDLAMIVAAFLLALLLRLGAQWNETTLDRAVPVLLMTICLALALELGLRLTSVKLSSFDLRGVTMIGLFVVLLSVPVTMVNAFLEAGVPRTVPAILGIVLFAMMTGWRGAARWMLGLARKRNRNALPLAVYGAGAAGVQLVSALAQNEHFRVVALVDDSPTLRGVYISGLRVQSPEVLEDLALSGRIRRVVLAIPSAPKRRLRAIVAELESLPCEVHAMPGYAELVSASDLVSSVRSVSSTDLLGRSMVDLGVPDVARAYAGRSVLISGAGGSIGSELCRQVLSCRPRKIVLFEISEFALYMLDREIGRLAAEVGVEIASVLGSVCDAARVRSVMQEHGVEIVLHAAAYKHVPLVEENELEGVRNNVFGTRTIAEAARDLKIERFVLVSTDKAVRPTNVMGSTKRLAEIVIQDLQSRCPDTRFAMVRFGNVLGSSGSVIPLFSSQIAAGGPITLTHPEVTRYFMTITEAARLVLLAGSYARGGDLFVLDMGKPVRIIDLARRMIGLSGLQEKTDENPDGDIEIRITGLRRGEKLYEELLIGGRVLPTPHPKIMRAHESCPSEIEVAGLLQELRLAIETNSPESARRQIARWVEGYRQPGEGTIAAVPPA